METGTPCLSLELAPALPQRLRLVLYSSAMSNGARVLLFIADNVLMRTLTEDLRKAGYLVDCCDSLETCQHVNSFYDHDVAFLQAEDDDLETLQAAASLVTPGARIVVVMSNPDPDIAEQLEMHGMQLAAFPRDSITLVELLREETGE